MPVRSGILLIGHAFCFSEFGKARAHFAPQRIRIDRRCSNFLSVDRGGFDVDVPAPPREIDGRGVVLSAEFEFRLSVLALMRRPADRCAEFAQLGGTPSAATISTTRKPSSYSADAFHARLS